MARPQEEHGVIATRVALLQYAIYAPAGVRDRRLPWIVYDQGSAGLPHARWIASALRRDPSSSIAVAVNDSDLALQAVRSGLGRTLLPTRIGDAVDGIVRSGNLTPVLRRELWLLVHPALKNVARVRAVIDWIKRTI
jgi:DNA-binding transcriptional LysR family regulator